jgi:flavin reductase (DIM6/NTAB) family NADH-FMN oxidoreductase RutF
MSQSDALAKHQPETHRGFADMLSADDFKSAFRNHPAGVAVITADIGAGPVGLTATSVISVSANPPLVVFSLSSASSSTPTVKMAETVVIHLLGAEQIDLAKNFATSGIDRFADKNIWSRLITG